jgi:hypothetical protein
VPGGTFRENMHMVPGEPNLPLRHPAGKFKYNYEELLAKSEKAEPQKKRPFSSLGETGQQAVVPEVVEGQAGTKDGTSQAITEIAMTA